MDQSIPEVKEDPQMPPGREGAFGEYPESEEDYAALRGDLPIRALLELRKFCKAIDKWGHVSHWVSATLAAYADGDDEKAKQCFSSAMMFRDAPQGVARDMLFKQARLLEQDDLLPGRRLNPAT